MSGTVTGHPDVMQVCRNGHVITDLLRSCPGHGLSHCDRCGATTQDRCGTCGQPLRGAVAVPGLVPVGTTIAPQFCTTCGAKFPWSDIAPVAVISASPLEPLLRRLPRVVRQLRSRHGTRPPFRVEDVYDLEDLLRALLPLHFDDVRPESRTPSYAIATRTDFLLDAGALAVVIKRTMSCLRESQLCAQWPEDVAYYRQRRACRALLGFVYDPEALLVEAVGLEKQWAQAEGEWRMDCVIVQ
ncbi:MAG: DUF2321 domain-containing protein [Gemmataceae bacterium]|nr:DUF2321 domain-containing protein [Gemmataceae bacterium]